MRYFLMLAVVAMMFARCSKNNASNPVVVSGPVPNVTFTMHLESGTQGMIVFASPSVDVRLSKVDLAFPAQQFSDTIVNPQPDTVFPKGSRIQLNEYTGINGGQRWVLKFIGVVVATGQPFTVTVNWDVV